MSAFDDPYHAAASLAITLSTPFPSVTETEAIALAWQAYRAFGYPQFEIENFRGEVAVCVHEIQSGLREHGKTPPEVLEKARGFLGK